jgi:hypothetical protein
MPGDRTIAAAVEEHFDRTCAMWRDEIANTPDEEWRSGDVDYLIPARHLCHAVVSADFYTGGSSVDEYDWHGPFAGDWEGMTPDELPDKQQALRALDEMREKVLARLGMLADADLAAQQTHAPWTGKTEMHRILYWLRHHQHHLGELHAELRRRGVPRAGWK